VGVETVVLFSGEKGYGNWKLSAIAGMPTPAAGGTGESFSWLG